jgi:hypothetical protein
MNDRMISPQARLASYCACQKDQVKQQSLMYILSWGTSMVGMFRRVVMVQSYKEQSVLS